MQLTREQVDAVQTLARALGPGLAQQVAVLPKAMPIEQFAHSRFYIPETAAPIVLMPHQIALLTEALSGKYQTVVYSTIKKSGKTAIASLVARWVAETFPGKNEVYCMANDLEQARGRIYAKAIESIELTPGYSKARRELPGQWHIIERDATFLPTGSIIRAVSSDYKGEAGSNPTATLWSELWGYQSEAAKRLWDELTPVPTRARSFRYVETYAGYEGESELLWDLYQLGRRGRKLTKSEIYWPFSDDPPVWVNENAQLFMYWDEGIAARRMPWQTDEYYRTQAITLRPLAFERLHLNKWTSSVGSFIPIEWWINCQGVVPPLDASTPVVLGVDAAVSNDCCAIAAVTRHPDSPTDIMLRAHQIWTPTEGHPIDLQLLEDYIREFCKNYNVVQVAFDAYQLHKMMTDLTKAGVAWCRPFSQAADRSKADKQLYDLILKRRITHYGALDAYEHIKNAAAKTNSDEDTKLRIIKKASNLKIDFTIALSMAVAECLRLNL